MSSRPSLRERAIVTGYCAAHRRLGADHADWVEYSSRRPPPIYSLFDVQAADELAEYSAPCDDRWWERFFSCGIIGALDSAGLWRNGHLAVEPTRVGICFCSSKGRPALWEKGDPFLENPIFSSSCDWALREVARNSGATGKRLCPVAACASGAHAVAIGAQWIEDGLCDVALCGAIEAELAPLLVAGYRSLGALSRSGVMRPFDEQRDGFVPSTGAACMILESETLAAKRGANALGAISGWSLLADATSLTGLDPSGDSICSAIDDALLRAGKLSLQPVDYVNAHGTATKMNDEAEARAIARVLGTQVAVSSTKPLTGHLLGAAGAVEAVLCVLAMQQNFAPPNLNSGTKDAACDINFLSRGQEMQIETALSLSYGFGGHTGVLVLEKN